jgi:hypothetical protein
MNEVNISIEKIDGGFLVYVNAEDKSFRKIVRKLSEVVAIVKQEMAGPAAVAEE